MRQSSVPPSMPRPRESHRIGNRPATTLGRRFWLRFVVCCSMGMDLHSPSFGHASQLPPPGLCGCLLAIQMGVPVVQFLHVSWRNCLRRADLQGEPDSGCHVFYHHCRFDGGLSALTDREYAVILQ